MQHLTFMTLDAQATNYNQSTLLVLAFVLLIRSHTPIHHIPFVVTSKRIQTAFLTNLAPHSPNPLLDYLIALFTDMVFILIMTRQTKDTTPEPL